jgi:hypothetical protein
MSLAIAFESQAIASRAIGSPSEHHVVKEAEGSLTTLDSRKPAGICAVSCQCLRPHE